VLKFSWWPQTSERRLVTTQRYVWTTRPPYVLVVAPAQLRQVGQLLDPDDGVVERRLQRLRHGVGKDHRDHHRQDVGDLAGQLEHDDRRGHRVGHRARQGRRTWRGGGGGIFILMTNDYK